MTTYPHSDQVFKQPPINPIPTHLLYPALDPSLIDYKVQSFEVPGTRKEGQTGHYRNRIFPDQTVLLQSPKPQTLYELVKQVTDEIPEDNALGTIPVTSPRGQHPVTYGTQLEWINYGEVEKARMEVGSAIMHLFRSGILGDQNSIERIDPHHSGPEGGWGVGIWSGNRAEWQITDMACHAFSLIGVPLYDTLGPSATEYVANHAGLPIIFTSIAHLPSMLKLLPNVPSVKAVVCMERLEGTEGEMAKDWGRREGVWVEDFEGLKQMGRANRIDPIPPKPESIATISYTSGTTGNPKGVVLTHRNMATAIIAQLYGTPLPPRGTLVCSYLPLSHVYGRFIDLMAVAVRGCAGYTTGDTLRLLPDIQIIKPNSLPSVPRVLNRIYAAIMAQANGGGVKGAILTKSINAKLHRFRETGDFTHPVYDKLFLSKLPALLGGKILFMSTGSAPISKDVFETLKISFASSMVEGWGMTETVGTGARNYANDRTGSGTIGPPAVCNEFKLVDIPEMGYSSRDQPFPRGELCVKGLNVFSGYYKDPKNTQETLDEDGWMHTGDVCSVDDAGRFKIIDRKKNIMKLAQGEYVALESVEGVYALHPVFTTMYVHGDSLKNHLVGVGVVDPVQAVQFIQNSAHPKLRHLKEPHHVTKAIAEDSHDAQNLKGEIVKSLEKLARSKGLKGYEMVKGVHLTNDPFPPEVMTPSFKFKRQHVAKHFKDELGRAYEESEKGEDAKDNRIKAML